MNKNDDYYSNYKTLPEGLFYKLHDLIMHLDNLDDANALLELLPGGMLKYRLIEKIKILENK